MSYENWDINHINEWHISDTPGIVNKIVFIWLIVIAVDTLLLFPVYGFPFYFIVCWGNIHWHLTCRFWNFFEHRAVDIEMGETKLGAVFGLTCLC